MTREEQNTYIFTLYNNPTFINKNKGLLKEVDEIYWKNRVVDGSTDTNISFEDKLTGLSDEELKNIYIRFSLKKLYFGVVS